MRPLDPSSADSAPRDDLHLSICIPCFNGERFVADAVDSALNQSRSQDVEVIAVDDGSTDRTAEILSRYAARGVKVTVNSSRLGMVANWNRCIDLASNDLVLVLHQDDILDRDMVKRTIEAFRRWPQAAMATTGHSWIVGGRLRGAHPTNGRDLLFAAGSSAVRFLLASSIACSGVTVRRAAYEVAGRFSEQFPYSADEEMWTRLASRWAMIRLSGALVRTRVHSGQFRNESWRKPDFLAAYLAVQYARFAYLGAEVNNDIARRRMAGRATAKSIAGMSLRLLMAGDLELARRYLSIAPRLDPTIRLSPRFQLAWFLVGVPWLGAPLLRRIVR